jgi:hypothetical protein
LCYVDDSYNYGLTQNPNTKVYILVFNDDYFNYYCKKCGNKCDDEVWCKQCQINQLKNNFTNWTSGNMRIDEFIQKMQLKIDKQDDTIFEWVPYNELIYIEEIEDNCLTTTIWEKEPLSYYNKKLVRRSSYEKICLKYLHNSRDITEEFLIEVLESFIKLN